MQVIVAHIVSRTLKCNCKLSGTQWTYPNLDRNIRVSLTEATVSMAKAFFISLKI